MFSRAETDAQLKGNGIGPEESQGRAVAVISRLPCCLVSLWPAESDYLRDWEMSFGGREDSLVPYAR